MEISMRAERATHDATQHASSTIVRQGAVKRDVTLCRPRGDVPRAPIG